MLTRIQVSEYDFNRSVQMACARIEYKGTNEYYYNKHDQLIGAWVNNAYYIYD